MQIIAESDIGYIGFEGNELTIGSKIDDPAKVRLTAPMTEHGGAGGVVSFNKSRQPGIVCDGHQQEEMAMLRVEQAEDVRGQVGNLKAEFNFLVNTGESGNDSAMVKPLAFVWNMVTRSLLSVFGGESRTDTMWAPNGLSFTQQQNDGNFVTYRTSVPFSKAGEHVTYIWQSGTAA